MARGYRHRGHMGRSSAAEGPIIALSPATHLNRSCNSWPRSEWAHCSHKKDQHGWQHEVRDLARPLGSI